MKQFNPTVSDSSAVDYDQWFDRHPALFQNEYKALRKAIPAEGIGIEIGAGTGRFAALLNIPVGVEPAGTMAQIALSRGIIVINAKAEALPFYDGSFDYAIMITAVCFLNDIPKAFAEAYRIIKEKGFFIVDMIDKISAMGRQYEAKKAASPWYKDAHFHTVPEITDMMHQAGFGEFEYWQTLFTGKEELTEPLPGFGKGSFVVIRSQKI